MYLRIDPRDGTPLYRQIVREVERAVALGTLHAGDRLPSIRRLGRQLRVNPNTVGKAYAELEHLGLAETRHGVGTLVRHKLVALSEVERRAIVAHLLDEALLEARRLGLDPGDLDSLIQERVARLDALAAAKQPDS